MYEGHYVYSLYIHLSGFIAKVGQRVGPGTPVGRVGHTGPATNDHLHLEVRLSKVKGDAMKDFIVVNPALFVSRRPGRGALTGRVRKGGKRLDGARIYGPIVPEPQDTPFGFFEVYGRGASGDPGLREDFMIMDIPPGVYPVEVVHRRETRSACVEIKAGVNTWIEVEF
jgi:murein DD-endopeptidase MepM/ murein hydrolase activator NlpD